MGKVMRHTLGASLNIRHNLSSSKGPKPLQLKLLTTYIPKTDRKSGSAGMPRPISYAVFCLKKKKTITTGFVTTHHRRHFIETKLGSLLLDCVLHRTLVTVLDPNPHPP